jgi:hypothetical protein
MVLQRRRRKNYQIYEKKVRPKTWKYEKMGGVNSEVRSPYNRPQGAQRGCRGVYLLMLDLGARRVGWSAPRPCRFTPGKDPVPIVQEAGWAPGPVWTCVKNLAHNGI